MVCDRPVRWAVLPAGAIKNGSQILQRIARLSAIVRERKTAAHAEDWSSQAVFVAGGSVGGKSRRLPVSSSTECRHSRGLVEGIRRVAEKQFRTHSSSSYPG